MTDHSWYRIIGTLLLGWLGVMLSAQAQKALPDWYVHPPAQSTECYGIGISDLNGTVAGRERQSLRRALLNLALQRECQVTSMLKRFEIVGDTIINERIIKIQIDHLPGSQAIKITRRWRGQDGRVFTEIQLPRDQALSAANRAIIRYYRQTKTIGGFEMTASTFDLATEIDGQKTIESFQEDNGVLVTSDFQAEYRPEFATGYDHAAGFPDGDEPSSASGRKRVAAAAFRFANLYVADLMATVNAARELALEIEKSAQSIATEYAESTDRSGIGIERSVSNAVLRNWGVARRGVKPADRQFMVFIRGEMESGGR